MADAIIKDAHGGLHSVGRCRVARCKGNRATYKGPVGSIAGCGAEVVASRSRESGEGDFGVDHEFSRGVVRSEGDADSVFFEHVMGVYEFQ